MFHQDSWKDERANIIIDDIVHYLDNYNGPKYDVVIMDIVDATESKEVALLYTVEFYTKLKNVTIDENSVFVTQSSALHLLNHNCLYMLISHISGLIGKILELKKECE